MLRSYHRLSSLYRKPLLSLSCGMLLMALALGLVSPQPAQADALLAGANDLRLSDMGGLGTPGTHMAMNPAIAYNSTNKEFLVVWEGTEGDATTEQSRIYGQRINAITGVEMGTNDFVVAEMPGDGADFDAALPSVAYNTTRNEYLIVFQGNLAAGATETEVYGQRLAGNGAQMGVAFRISDMGVDGDTTADVFDAPDVAYNATGDEYLVVWRGDDVGNNSLQNGEFEVFGQRLSYDAGSNLVETGANDFQISDVGGTNGTNAEFDAESPAAAWNSVTNQYLVVWHADETIDGYREIYGQRIDAAGSAQGSNDFQISHSAGGLGDEAYTPDAAVNSTNGEYLVVWSGDRSSNDVFQIHGQRLGQDGSPGGTDDFQISSTGGAANPANEPSAVYNSRENEYLVSWQGSTNAAPLVTGENEIFAQRVSAAGGETGRNDFRISDMGPNGDISYGANSPSGVAYSGPDLNSYFAAWSGSDNRESQVAGEEEVFGQAIEPVLDMTKTLQTSSAGVDAGDSVRYQIEVRHKQVNEGGVMQDASLRDAYNLVLVDDVPDILQNVSLVSATISDGANSTNVAGSFSITPGGNLTTTGDVDLRQFTNGANHQTLTVVLEGKVRDAVYPAATIGNTAALTWQNYDPGILVHLGYVASASSASISIPGTLEVVKTASQPEAAIGQTVTYQLAVSVVEGTTQNLHLVDTLPAGMSYVAGSAQVSNANGMTISGMSASTAGQNLTIDIASVTNPGNVDNPAALDQDTFWITYSTRVLNTAGNQDNVTLTNDVDASGSNVPPDNNNAASVKVVEPTLSLTKTASDPDPVFGQTVTFQVTVAHQLASTADAYELVITDALPAGLSYVTGSASLPPAQVDETGDPTIVFTIPSLAKGGSVSFTYQAIVGYPPKVAVGTQLTNSQKMTWTSQPGANADERSGSGGLNDYASTASSTVTASSPEIGLVKSDGNITALPGGSIPYSLSYTNHGNQTATGVVITEIVPANTIFNPGASAPGWSCTPDNNPGSLCTNSIGTVADGAAGVKVFAVTAANPIAAGVTQVDNTAEISQDEYDPDPGNNSSSDTTPVDAAPDLEITKDDGGTAVQPGGGVTYSLDYTNAGNQDATGVVITEIVPANTTFDPTASTAGWSCTPDNNPGSECIFDIGELAGGGSGGSVTFSVTIANPAPAGLSQISNTTSLADDGANGPDPTPGNNTSTDTTPVDAAPDLTIDKDDGGGSALPGDTIGYTLSYTNQGNQDASGVELVETVPANTTFNPAQSSTGWSCTPDSSAGSQCRLATGSLAVGGSGSAVFAVDLANPAPAGASQVSNSASIQDDGTNGTDLTPTDNTTSDTTPVDAAPDLGITKDDGGVLGLPGTTITYTLTYRNTGNQDASGVTITDTVPTYTTFDPGSSTPGWSCAPDQQAGSLCTFDLPGGLGSGVTGSVQFAVTIDDPLPAGASQVDNTAFISDDGSNGADPNPGDEQSSVTTTLDGPPTITALTPNPTRIDENGSLDLSIEIEDPGLQEVHTILIDWGDGSSESVLLSVGDLDYQATHQYLDDNPSGTASDSYTIQVTVTEEDEDSTMTSTTVTVDNLDPSISNLSTSSPIDENGAATLSGEIADAGTEDSFTLTVDWGDGSAAETFTYPAGTASFSETHTYPDDNPSGTLSDNYAISLSLSDDDRGSATAGASVTVNNLNPDLSNVSISSPLDENGTASLSGEISDAGTEDSFTLTVDWGDGSAAETFTYPAGTASFSETHTYLDDDPTGTAFDSYAVNLTLTDDDGGSDSASGSVTVNNLAPALANVAITSPIDENSLATLSGEISDAGTLDTFTLTVYWGDGSAAETITYPAGTASFSETHLYPDNPPINGYTASLTLTDDDGGSDSATADVTVNNLDPSLANVAITPRVDENGLATLSGEMSDPGVQDPLTLTVDWGDGSAAETFNYPAGTASFSEAHTYLDDEPTGTASDNYAVNLTLTDDDGGSDSASGSITVDNVDPGLAKITVTSPVAENSAATLSAEISDAGTQDSFTLVVDWGDGSVTETFNYPAGMTSFSETHTYLDDNPSGTAFDNYAINLSLSDDDGGSATAGASVTVENVSPEVDAGSDLTRNEGDLVKFDGFFTDPGTMDTHILEWVFSNGITTTGTLTPSLIYPDNGLFMVRLSVTDDDGGLGQDELELIVLNVAPEVEAGSDQAVLTDEPVHFSGSFTDPGVLDTHTIEWDFGDGMSATGVLTPTHTYAGPGVYTATLKVIDQDGGTGQDSLNVKVQQTAYPVYLPLVMRAGQPDLIGTFDLSPDKLNFTAGEPVTITVEITNVGNAPAKDFWVDLYINPATLPIAPNQTWDKNCGMNPCYGIAWYVNTVLRPGESLTLVSTPDSFSPAHTIWPGFFASGSTDLYLYVDSWNPGVNSGAVLEKDETNNVADLSGLVVIGSDQLAPEMDGETVPALPVEKRFFDRRTETD